MEALDSLIAMGFNRILTSGQQPTADQGIPLLRQLHDAARGRIAIMAGCGVNEQNIHSIFTATGIREYHFSARETIRRSAAPNKPQVYMGTPGMDEAALSYTTSRRVKTTISALISH